MEPSGFLISPQQNNNALKITSWNINSVKSKLENSKVYNLLNNYDIISLNEVKTTLNICIPGYINYSSRLVSGAASKRGSTVVLVKHYLSNQIFNVDKSIVDQVWLQLRCLPDIMFGFCYVPPADSEYFTHQSFVALHDKMIDSKGNTKFCIVGDLNARFGTFVRNMLALSNIPDVGMYEYPIIPDEISTPNNNAYILSNLCIDNNLLVLNNLKTHNNYFPSKKTFKRNQWISELDTVTVSYNLLEYICNFNVHQTLWLPSDHAPISFDIKLPKFNLDNLMKRASVLGGHGSLMVKTAQVKLVNRPIKFKQIDQEKFLNIIPNVTMPILSNDVNTLSTDISQTLYDCVRSCSNSSDVGCNVSETDNANLSPVKSYHDRWDRLLNDPDDSRVWRALDWKGNLDDRDVSNNPIPSDVEFKDFFDKFLVKHNNMLELESNDNRVCPNIPVLDNPVLPDEVFDQISKMKVNKSCGPDGIPLVYIDC